MESFKMEYFIPESFHISAPLGKGSGGIKEKNIVLDIKDNVPDQPYLIRKKINENLRSVHFRQNQIILKNGKLLFCNLKQNLNKHNCIIFLHFLLIKAIFDIKIIILTTTKPEIEITSEYKK